MNRVLLLIVILFFVPRSGNAQNYTWSAQVSNTSEILKEQYFVNDVQGYAVGYNGEIIKTINGGDVWVNINSPTSYNVTGVYFENIDHGFICDAGGHIYETGDGGSTWALNFYSPIQSFYGMDYNNGRIFVIRGSDLLTSNSNGVSWDSVAVASITGLDFSSGSTGFASTLTGDVYRTTNNGDSWTNLTGVSNTFVLWEICAATAQNVLAVGDQGTIIATTDGGNTWFNVTSGTAETLWDIDFANDGQHGIICGSNNVVLETTDGGLSTWFPTPTTEVGASAYDVFVASPTLAYVFFSNGAVHRSPIEYDICEVVYLGPDTVCTGVPFDFEFQFKNCGPSDALDPEFQVLINSSNVFSGSVVYPGLVDVGNTVTTIAGTITLGAGVNDVLLFAEETFNALNSTITFDIVAVDPDPSYILGSTFFCPGDTVTIEAFGGLDYFWQSGTGGDIFNPVQVVYPTQTSSYIVQIEQEYCTVFDTVWVYLEPFCQTTIDSIVPAPSESYAFSPNYDGVNDFLYLDFIDPQSGPSTVTIYNRWGDIVFESGEYDNVEDYWDGGYGNRQSPPGTYYLVAETSNVGVVKAWVQLVK